MIGEFIFSALLEEPTITTIVGDRIYPEEFPDADEYYDDVIPPTIVYEELSVETLPTYTSVYGHSFLVRFNCIARDYDEAVELAEALTAVLDGATITSGGYTLQQSYLEGSDVETNWDIYEKPYFSVIRDFMMDVCTA